MSKYYLFQDTKKCIGCHSCEVQCKSNKSLPVGPKLCQVVAVGPQFVGELPKAAYIFMPCFHCETPWCVAACPTGATCFSSASQSVCGLDAAPPGGGNGNGLEDSELLGSCSVSGHGSPAAGAWLGLVLGLLLVLRRRFGST